MKLPGRVRFGAVGWVPQCGDQVAVFVIVVPRAESHSVCAADGQVWAQRSRADTRRRKNCKTDVLTPEDSSTDIH
jgi:hypothetical protein